MPQVKTVLVPQRSNLQSGDTTFGFREVIIGLTKYKKMYDRYGSCPGKSSAASVELTHSNLNIARILALEQMGKSDITT